MQRLQQLSPRASLGLTVALDELQSPFEKPDVLQMPLARSPVLDVPAQILWVHRIQHQVGNLFASPVGAIQLEQGHLAVELAVAAKRVFLHPHIHAQLVAVAVDNRQFDPRQRLGRELHTIAAMAVVRLAGPRCSLRVHQAVPVAKHP